MNSPAEFPANSHELWERSECQQAAQQQQGTAKRRAADPPGREEPGPGRRRISTPKLFLTTVGAGRTIATYKPKSYIFRQGTKCDAVYYIQKGHIELSVVSSQGKERVVGMLGPGASSAKAAWPASRVYLASARASTEATVVRVEAETMIQAIHEHPELSERFMAFLLLRNSQIEADLVDQLFNSSEKRLARLLIMLAQVGQEAELRTVVTPISQEVMAARVGTTRSRINYFMNKFRKLGLIEYNGELKVHSSLLNVIVRE